MSTEKCWKCDGNLVSATEMEAGSCLKCYPAVVKELDRVSQELSEKIALLEETKGAIVDAVDKNDRFVAVLEAEKAGSEACARGIPVTDNPHPEGDLRKHWEIGWSQENLSAAYGKLRALFIWTTEHLAHVRELAKGYGQDEIATKLELVFEKVSPYIGDL